MTPRVFCSGRRFVLGFAAVAAFSGASAQPKLLAGGELVLESLATSPAPEGKISRVSVLGGPNSLAFTQDESGLKVSLPARVAAPYAFVLKITGLKMNPPVIPADGNPL